MKNEPMCYVDETTFYSTMSIRYAWQPLTERLEIPINMNKGQSITVFGCVSDRLQKGGYFEQGCSTNKEEYLRFMLNLAREFKKDGFDFRRKVWCVTDNAQAHKGADTIA